MTDRVGGTTLGDDGPGIALFIRVSGLTATHFGMVEPSRFQMFAARLLPRTASTYMRSAIIGLIRKLCAARSMRICSASSRVSSPTRTEWTGCRECSTSGVTGGDGATGHSRLRRDLPGYTRRFVGDRTGCDRRWPATTRQCACSTCVSTWVPISTTTPASACRDDVLSLLTTAHRRRASRGKRTATRRQRHARP